MLLSTVTLLQFKCIPELLTQLRSFLFCFLESLQYLIAQLLLHVLLFAAVATRSAPMALTSAALIPDWTHREGSRTAH